MSLYSILHENMIPDFFVNFKCSQNESSFSNIFRALNILCEVGEIGKAVLM